MVKGKKLHANVDNIWKYVQQNIENELMKVYIIFGDYSRLGDKRELFHPPIELSTSRFIYVMNLDRLMFHALSYGRFADRLQFRCGVM